MKLNDETSLICVNAILQLKSGTPIDLYAAGSSSDGRDRSHRRVGVRLIGSISRQTHEAASVGSLFRYFDLLALSLVVRNDGSRFDDG